MGQQFTFTLSRRFLIFSAVIILLLLASFLIVSAQPQDSNIVLDNDVPNGDGPPNQTELAFQIQSLSTTISETIPSIVDIHKMMFTR